MPSDSNVEIELQQVEMEATNQFVIFPNSLSGKG